jgi:hypothetical protein
MIDGFDKTKFLTRLLIGIAILYFFVGLNFDLNIYDEGVGLVGAERVGTGDIPYQDFFTIYAPFNYYLIAAYSLLFGGSVMSPRFLDLILFVFAFAGAHRIIVKSNNGQPEFLAGIAMIIVFGFELMHSYAEPNVPAVTFGIFAMLFTVNQIYEDEYIWKDDDSEPEKKPKPLTKYLVLSGVMTGLLMITRHFTGVFLLATLLINVFFTFDIPLRDKFRATGKIFTGTFVIVLPVMIYFLLTVPFDLIFEQLAKIPLFVFPAYRELPRPVLASILNAETGIMSFKLLWHFLFIYLPMIFIIYIFVKFVKYKIRRISVPDRYKAAFPLAVFSFFLILQSSVRNDIEHFIPVWIFSILAFFILFNFKTQSKTVSIFITLILVGFLLFPLAEKSKIIGKIYNKKQYIAIKDIPRAERFIINKKWYEDLSPAIAFIKNHTGKSERIFVCNNINDKSYITDVMFYFLAERLPGTRYHELHPGVSTTLPVQKELIKDLEKNDVKYIVIFKGYPNINEPNLSSKSSGVKLLDNYIEDNFSTVKRFGIYEIKKLK